MVQLATEEAVERDRIATLLGTLVLMLFNGVNKASVFDWTILQSVYLYFCLSVCPCHISKSNGQILMKFLGHVPSDLVLGVI